jgi:lysophospholipase L1-like esterase
VIFAEGQKLLFMGDSVTSSFRRSEAHRPYGNGFVNLVRALLLARYPALDLTVENRGAGGLTVRKAALRWESDVIAERSDWLAVMLGINDGLFSLMSHRLGEAVSVGEYERTYRRLLRETTTRTGARLILLEPCVVVPPPAGDPALIPGVTLEALSHAYPALMADADTAYRVPLEEARRTHPHLFHPDAPRGAEWERCQLFLRALVDERRAVVARLAREFVAVLVRTQDAFDDALRYQPPWYWALDRVHPSAAGHAVIARAFLRGAGYGDV